MGRRARVEYRSTTYHAYCRGNRGAPVFRHEDEFREYTDDLARLSKAHGAVVHAFQLMTNHTHLSVRTDGDPLSVLMQRLNLRHAKRYNRMRRTRGHLNQSRYQAKVVTSARYLVSLVRYIHQNPVKARMVERPEDWPFSSARAYLGLEYPWVETADVKARLGGDAGYAEFMRLKPTREELDLFVRGKQPESWLPGDPVFGRPGDNFRWQQVRLLERGPWVKRKSELDVWQVAEAEAARLGRTLEELARPSKKPELVAAREQLALLLDARGFREREIAEVISRAQSVVSMLLVRSRPGARDRAEDAERGQGRLFGEMVCGGAGGLAE